MGKAKGFLDEIRTMHAHEPTGANELQDVDRYQRCWDLMALLGIRTKEDIKDERTKEDVEKGKKSEDDKIKLKEVVEAWQEKMRNKKGNKKSGTAEGQEKKDKKRSGNGQEKDKKRLFAK